MLHNLVQQRRAIHRSLTLRAVHEITIAGRAVYKRCLKLLLCCIQIQQQLQHLVMHLHRVGMRAVNLIDDHNRQQPLLQRLAQHKTRLCLRALVSIHHQNHTVHHLHHTLHLSTEIRVPGCIHNVNRVIIPVNRRILRLNRDTLLAFQIHRIHGALLHFLILAVSTTSLKQLVHQRCLTVVNVGDNSQIAEFARVTHNQ